MNGRGRPYSIAFVLAACLHAGLLFAGGKVLQTRAEFAIAAGESVELTLVESAGEQQAELAPEPPPEPLPPPLEPIAEPPVDPPPPEPLDAPEPQMIEPPREEPPTPTTRPKSERTSATTAPKSHSTQRAVTTAAGRAGSGARTQAKPDYLSNPPPAYPAASRQAGEQGVVMLVVSVTEHGRAAAVRLKRSSGFARLDTAARTAVQRWRFSPAKIGGIPVGTEVEVPVRFQLK